MQSILLTDILWYNKQETQDVTVEVSHQPLSQVFPGVLNTSEGTSPFTLHHVQPTPANDICFQ